MNKSGLSILVLLMLVPTAFLRAQWFENYAKGREAVAQGNWQEAVNQLTEALKDEPDSKHRKKTYSLQFSDYFPYLYRGIAYYKLGDMVRARADLENEESKKEIARATDDKEAPALLAEYLGYLQKSVAQVPEQKPPPIVQQKPQQKPAQNPVPAIQQPDAKKLEATARKEKKERVDKALASGEADFKADDLEKAREQFESVIALEPSNRRAAEFLKRIENRKEKLAAAAAARPKEPVPVRVETHPLAVNRVSADTAGFALFGEGVALYNDGKFSKAKLKFQSLQKIAPSYPELSTYTGLIAGIEGKVQMGISSFLQGDYRVAIEQLGSSARNGNDNPHVYAILACSYAAQYLLEGSEDGNLKKGAAEAFEKVKAINPRYALDPKLISPGIIALLTGE